VKVDLQLVDPLSQVVFVHDYVQLVFQDRAFSLFNSLTYCEQSSVLPQGSPGFCDSLVALIGQPATADFASGSLTLKFSTGQRVVVSNAGSGPEAWMFTGVGIPTVVEQNA
jgi:hypothetical protein